LERVRSNADGHSPNDGQNELLYALVRTYGGEDKFYLNYYSPSGAIKTIPYYKILEKADGQDSRGANDLAGKVVFVGAVGLSTPGAQDHYDTVFSDQLSGVEIAATAFANLLTDRAIKPLNDTAGAGIALALGLLVGLFVYVLRGIYAAAAIVALGGAYFALAAFLFAAHSVWVPVLIPTALQVPVGLFFGLYWKYRNVRVSHATCLSTDIEQFTKLSERMSREKRDLEFRAMMSKYFRMIGGIVRHSRGKVSHSGDDSTMNFWDAPQEDRNRRLEACLGAIKIARAVARFNQEQNGTGLPTRFGLDAGEVTITTTGDGRHESYSVDVGDAANAANRIERLNKKLGTRLLASEAVVGDLDGLLLRPVGTFLVEGKDEPLPVSEIICHEDDAQANDRERCARFRAALEAFQSQDWLEAIMRFDALLRAFEIKDGPSQFYLELCTKYQIDGPPPEHPVVRVAK
jgi:adenylate cyclase